LPSESTYDCIIIGGGPAGLTCGIFLGRYRRRTLLIHNSRPRHYASRAIHGFLGPHGIAPAELLKRGCDEARAAGVEICECTAERIERVGDIFEVTTTTGTFRGRRIALAYGVRDLLPDDIPELDAYYGTSIFHCPDCDAYEVAGKRIGVIGWGKRAVGFSLRLLQWSDDITVFAHGHDRGFSKEETSKLLAEQINVVDERIIQLKGDNGHLTSVVLATGEHIEVDAMFFTIGTVPSCDLAARLGVTSVDDTACLTVDDFKQTNVEGVYAIGDLAPGSQLAITSAADGAVAAIAINKSLLPPSHRG